MATSYCTVADIERVLQITFDADFKPTAAQAQDFADARAAVLTSLCYQFGVTTDPDLEVLTTPRGRMLREANAIGAGLDCALSMEIGQTPLSSDRIARLTAQWRQYTGMWDGITPNWMPVQGFLELQIKGSLAVNHITSGVESEDVDVPGVEFDDEF